MRASWVRVSRRGASRAGPLGPAQPMEMDYQMNHACRLTRRPVTRRSNFLTELTSFLTTEGGQV
ncbi:hypothetical protein ACWEPL_64740 [Nonomuraea sp. NPDC004186]